MSSEFQSEQYKRGFITGMAMNPLFVTTETAPPAVSDGGGVISALPGGIVVGVINGAIKAMKGDL